MKSWLCCVVAVLFLATVFATGALTPEEVFALQTMTLACPALVRAPSLASLYNPPLEDSAIDYDWIGGIWPSQWRSDSCATDGWIYYGVHCGNGHIDKIHLYVHFSLRGAHWPHYTCLFCGSFLTLSFSLSPSNSTPNLDSGCPDISKLNLAGLSFVKEVYVVILMMRIHRIVDRPSSMFFSPQELLFMIVFF